MLKNICIPTALLLTLDDIAWHNGRDLRDISQASRSGLPRDHHPEDYKIIAELGKALGMRILCPLCLGDWDKENILRGEVGVTHDPYNWDRASKINLEYANKCFEALESADYIEYAIHGILHGAYDENGKLIWEKEHFVKKFDENGKAYPHFDSDNFKRRLDLFFKLYNMWGFSQKIRAYVSPCGMHGVTPEAIDLMAEELYPRGIRFGTNAYYYFPESFKVHGGITFTQKCGNNGGKFIPWNAFDVDPDYIIDFTEENLPASSVIGMHWTNFLRYNPENNMERLDAWVRYMNRQAEVFGIMLSKDIAFSNNQQFYEKYTKITEGDGKIVLDFSDVLANRTKAQTSEVYISFRNGNEPKTAIGGTLELYDTRKGHKTYKITHEGDRVELVF